MMPLGVIIKTKRVSKLLTRQELAEMCGIREGEVACMERIKRIDVVSLVKVLDNLGVNGHGEQ